MKHIEFVGFMRFMRFLCLNRFFQNIVYRVVCWGGGLVARKCRVGGRPKQQKPTIAHVLISFFNPELAFKPTKAIETRVPLIAPALLSRRY